MNTFTDFITETFHVVSCYTCGVRFGISGDLYRRAVTNATGSIYCPACGKLTAWQESADQKRIKELERKLKWEADNSAQQRQLKEEAQASLSATKAVVTRMKKRASAGVCPCCNRTFKQLAEHMAAMHPEFKDSSSTPPP